MGRIILVLVIALIGAFIFQILHIPIPWLLGPIVVVMLAQFKWQAYMYWPTILRNIGLIILGVAIGQQFNVSIIQSTGSIIIAIIIVNIVLMLFSLLLAYVLSKWTDLSFKSAVTATVPGGLSQLVLFAEEEKDIPLAVVTYFHVVRVICVVLFVPFIVSGQVGEKVTIGDGISWTLIIVIGLAAVFIPIGKRLRIPVPHFLTPILLCIVLQFTPLMVPVVPSVLLNSAQLLIGAYIGLLLKPHMLKLPKRLLIAGVVSSFALLLITGVSSVFVMALLDISFATSFLSTAPGGLDQMGILAAEVGADISVVTVFQLLRLLMIFTIVLPLMKWTFKNRA